MYDFVDGLPLAKVLNRADLINPFSYCCNHARHYCCLSRLIMIFIILIVAPVIICI